jgi:hypothetical protein
MSIASEAWRARGRAGGRYGGPLALVLLASFLFRLPAFVNAAQTNADAAVVGLQAMHFLRGEGSWFLWGSGYQTSVDSGIAALFFAVMGATPRALMLSSFGLHLGLTALAWSALARRLDPARAAVAVLPLVFTSSPLETYILYPPREASLFVAVLALWIFDRAADRDGPGLLALGAAVLGLACFADPYALVLAAPVGAFGAACAGVSARRLGALVAGGAVGAVPLVLLHQADRARGGVLGLSFDLVAHNARLLVDPCLPWAVGAASYGQAGGAIDYGKLSLPLPIAAIQIAGGTLFLLAVAAGGACVFARRLAWPVRRFAIVGGVGLVATLGGFLASPMVMDLFSARYLAALAVVAPFAFAPLAAQLGRARFVAIVAPCVAATGIAGWVGRGQLGHPPVDGDADEMRLEAALALRGVSRATADYWTAYRLTFLAQERVIVVPVNAGEDRYAPYRAAFDAAPVVAYVYDPLRSREAPTWMDARVRAGETPFDAEPERLERIEIGRFSVLILRRRRGAAAAGSCNPPAPRTSRSSPRTSPG